MMNMSTKCVLSILLALTIFVFNSCDYIDVHPYAGQLHGKLDINSKNIARIEKEFANNDTIRYAFITDSQRWYDELESFVHHANSRNDIDFILHGGDVTDFGLTKEFLWQRDILEKLKQPYVVIIGNHDCLGNGEDIFKQVFGDLNFTFIAGKTKFICLNTNALETDYSVPVPDFSFIRDERAKDVDMYNQTVLAMHAKPYSEQFNNNVAEIFHYSINQFPNFMFANHGHNHRYEVNDTFNDGINYYGAPNIGKRQYLLFTITPNDYTYELVSY